MTWLILVEEVSASWLPSRFEKETVNDERWWVCLLFCSARAVVVCHVHMCVQDVYIYAYLSHQRTARALTARNPLSPSWVMANSPAWCRSPYLRARECEGRDRQRSRGWMAVWKDGLEQPVVKDRRSLTGADADTSAMALHHLPFSGHANHAAWRVCLLFPDLALSLFIPVCIHMQSSSVPDVYRNRKDRWWDWEVLITGFKHFNWPFLKFQADLEVPNKDWYSFRWCPDRISSNPYSQSNN